MDAVANRYLSLVDLVVLLSNPLYFNSAADICKGTVTSANIDTLCSHSGSKHTWLTPYGIDNFKSTFPGNATATTSYWSGHRLLCDFGTGTTYTNKPCSSGYSIFMVGKIPLAVRTRDSTGTLMHELNHQYGVPDHNHDRLSNGKCRSGKICSECGDEGMKRPKTCIMNDMFQDINLSTILCAGCRGDMTTHLENHHKIF
jgi:hypothetical protein